MENNIELTEEEQKDFNKRLSIAMVIFFTVILILLVVFMFICYKLITVNDLESAKLLLLGSCIFAIVTFSASRWLGEICIKLSGLDKYDISDNTPK